MKPFDLEAAKRGDPIVTRNGRDVVLIAHILNAVESYSVLVMMEGEAVPYFVTSYGNSSWRTKDLFMKKKTRKVWCRMYRHNGVFLAAIPTWTRSDFEYPSTAWASEPFEVEVDV